MTQQPERPVYTPPPIPPDSEMAWNDPLITPGHIDMDESHPLMPHIIQAIRTVYDPEIPVNIYELGLIYQIIADDKNNVDVKMTLTSPGCPVAGEMPGMVQSALFNCVADIGDVNVDIIWQPPWNKSLMAETAQLELGMF